MTRSRQTSSKEVRGIGSSSYEARQGQLRVLQVRGHPGAEDRSLHPQGLPELREHVVPQGPRQIKRRIAQQASQMEARRPGETDALGEGTKRDRRPLDVGDETPEAPIRLDAVPRDLRAESLAGRRLRPGRTRSGGDCARRSPLTVRRGVNAGRGRRSPRFPRRGAPRTASSRFACARRGRGPRRGARRTGRAGRGHGTRSPRRALSPRSARTRMPRRGL